MDYLTNDTDLTAVADAIREKGGTNAALEWPSGYVDAIDAIETGGGGSTSLTHAGFFGVDGGRIYYTDENMQQQSGTSLDANLPSGSIVAVMTTSTSQGIMFAPGPYGGISFGLTSVSTVTANRLTYAQVFVVN